MTENRWHSIDLTAAEFREELESIVRWWHKHSPDRQFGGFAGEIDVNDNQVDKAPKGIILNARILWFCSEASRYLGCDVCRWMADRAYHYFTEYFDDKDYGGAFWELDYRGEIVVDVKKPYAQSFCIYGLCSYYRLTGEQRALDLAISYFKQIEKHCHDDMNGGYREAFSRSWQPLEDGRLSEKDENQPKSMNTHLHLLEAYTALYRVSPTADRAAALRRLLGYFRAYIIDSDSFHLRLFMDDEWGDRSSTVSYGHDIEASWLIWEALEVLGDEQLTDSLKPLVIKMAEVCLSEGIAGNGNLCDELCLIKGERRPESCWWVQAEALVGFFNAYTLTGNREFLVASARVWRFIKNYQVDSIAGEWGWYSILDPRESGRDYKAGFWKGPYHNGRSMMEVCRRLMALETDAAVNRHFESKVNRLA